MSWAHSKKFRFQAKAMNRQLDLKEREFRAKVEATVKVYSAEELEAFARERGQKVAASANESAKVLNFADYRRRPPSIRRRAA